MDLHKLRLGIKQTRSVMLTKIMVNSRLSASNSWHLLLPKMSYKQPELSMNSFSWGIRPQRLGMYCPFFGPPTASLRDVIIFVWKRSKNTTRSRRYCQSYFPSSTLRIISNLDGVLHQCVFKKKQNKDPNELNNRRPIAVFTFLRRLFSRVIISLSRPFVGDHIYSSQRGCAESNFKLRQTIDC